MADRDAREARDLDYCRVQQNRIGQRRDNDNTRRIRRLFLLQERRKEGELTDAVHPLRDGRQ